MPQILVDDLTKRFHVAVRDPGLAGAFRGLIRRRSRDIVALNRIAGGKVERIEFVFAGEQKKDVQRSADGRFQK